jgi:hypothetical protein
MEESEGIEGSEEAEGMDGADSEGMVGAGKEGACTDGMEGADMLPMGLENWARAGVFASASVRVAMARVTEFFMRLLLAGEIWRSIPGKRLVLLSLAVRCDAVLFTQPWHGWQAGA